MLKAERKELRDKAVKLLKRAESSTASADVEKNKKAAKFIQIAQGYIDLANGDTAVEPVK